MKFDKPVVKSLMVILCSCMRSLRDPLLEAQLGRDRKSSLWLFAAEITVRVSFPSSSEKSIQTVWLNHSNIRPVHQATLLAIEESFSELLLFTSLRRSKHSDSSQSKESRACLAYLLFVQLITMESFPAVFRWDGKATIWSDCDDDYYCHLWQNHLQCPVCWFFSPLFVLQCNTQHINQLLSRYDVAMLEAECKSWLERTDFLMFSPSNSKKESHLLKGLVRSTCRHVLRDATVKTRCDNCVFSPRCCVQKAWRICRTTAFQWACWNRGASTVFRRWHELASICCFRKFNETKSNGSVLLYDECSDLKPFLQSNFKWVTGLRSNILKRQKNGKDKSIAF